MIAPLKSIMRVLVQYSFVSFFPVVFSSLSKGSEKAESKLQAEMVFCHINITERQRVKKLKRVSKDMKRNNLSNNFFEWLPSPY